jgi:hypothetical protein
MGLTCSYSTSIGVEPAGNSSDDWADHARITRRRCPSRPQSLERVSLDLPCVG